MQKNSWAEGLRKTLRRFVYEGKRFRRSFSFSRKHRGQAGETAVTRPLASESLLSRRRKVRARLYRSREGGKIRGTEAEVSRREARARSANQLGRCLGDARGLLGLARCDTFGFNKAFGKPEALRGYRVLSAQRARRAHRPYTRRDS